MTTTQPAALPEPTQEQLGTPAAHADYSLGWFNVGWARCMAERARDAMWAERLAALQPKPADVSDAEISRLWSWSATAEAERTATTQQHAFAYALLALRPQAVPMTDGVFDLICNAIDKADTLTLEGDYMLDSDDCIAVVRVMQVLLSIRHGITAQGAQGGEG